MAGSGLEYGQVRDIDEARIFAESEIADREHALELRDLAQGHERVGSIVIASTLRSQARLADSSAAASGNLMQQAFNGVVSRKLEKWTLMMLSELHEPGDIAQLNLSQTRDISPVVNNTALRRFSQIVRTEEPQPVQTRFRYNDGGQIFSAQTSRVSSAFGVEILEGVVRPKEHPRSAKYAERAIFIRKLPKQNAQRKSGRR